MCLLNVSTFEIQKFFDDDVPSYAILSHTWASAGEPTYRDMLDGAAVGMEGYDKIKGAAEKAKNDGLMYVWVDTVCIDKTDSTELFEAINSMYRWYEQARTCYVYLSDVGSSDDQSNFVKSRWFSRGWTLQELLAPSEVTFFTKSWHYIGRKSDSNLRAAILKGCQISEPEGDLLADFRRDEWSVAEKMSWASHRKTTRKEDLAYCLLGIFNVHMPLLYGEGERAFIRLQEEIMRVSDDRSIFAWVDRDTVPGSLSGLLARHPSAFSIDPKWRCKARWSPASGQHTTRREPHRMTSQGVYLQVPLFDRWGRSIYHAMLGYNQSMPGPAIIVERLSDNEFIRVHADTFATTGEYDEHGHLLENVYTRNTSLTATGWRREYTKHMPIPGALWSNSKRPHYAPNRTNFS